MLNQLFYKETQHIVNFLKRHVVRNKTAWPT